MASRYAATNPARPRKLVTYGMPSRNRRSDNVALASEHGHAASREQESSENAATTSDISTLKVRLAQPDPSPVNRESHPSGRRSDGIQKRTHSTAFDAHASSITRHYPPAKSSSPSAARRTTSKPTTNRANHSTPPARAMRPTAAEAIVADRTRPSSSQSSRTASHTSNAKHNIRAYRSYPDTECEDERKTPKQPTPRRRLIDALTAQRVESPDPVPFDSQCSPSRPAECNIDVTPQRLQPSLVQIDSQSRRIDARGMTPTRKKIKFTYSQSRSILSSPRKAESSVTSGYADEHEILNTTPARMSTPPRSPSPLEDIGEQEDTKHAIQSIHELRRAGARNRFSDEMDDLLSRIGTPGPSPSTMRRNGLCELVHMLQKEEFASQFRDHAARDNIAKDIQGEKDIISAFALSAVLVIFLSSNMAPHLLRQLSEDRIGLWLGQFLANDDDIASIAAQRSANLSKATKTSLLGVKKILMQMSIWHNHIAFKLSPRIIALQLLTILIRSSDAQYLLQIVVDSSKDVARLADYYINEGSTEDVDFDLVISILEAQSNLDAIIGQSVPDSQQHASRVAKFLQWTLQRWPGKRSAYDATLLKLATNITNNEAGAAAFNDPILLSNLAHCICSGFGSVKSAMGNNTFDSVIYDELSLILGIFINIVEHCENARVSAGGRPLESLLTMWLDNLILMKEADSVEKSKLSIALGYLAVLLGYLFLSPSCSSGESGVRINLPSMRELVASIQEFIDMYKSVDSRVHELEGLVGELLRQDQQERSQAEKKRSI